jgi:SAM-dependent methyltransferase
MIQRIRRVPLDWISPYVVAAYAAGDVSGLCVLDYGCGAGVLLDRLSSARLRVGLDVSRSALERTRARCGADTSLVRIGIRGPLPFPSETFDLVTTTEVIEHVPNERAMLAEISRVLKPGGRLVLTTPHQHWLSALDVGNLKFRFPDLHAFYWRTVRGMSPSAFAERYGGGGGLIGDISVQSDPWHRHYSLSQLGKLCDGMLRIEEYYVFGAFARILQPIALALPRRLSVLARWLRRRDHVSRRVFSSQGYDICIVARRVGGGDDS